MISRRFAAAALAAAALLAQPWGYAGAGDGMVLRQSLHRVSFSGEDEAVGGVEAWLRATNSHTVVQSFTVWFRGLYDAEGATLWMATPDSFELEEVAAFAVSDNGSGIWTVKTNSGWDEVPELPLGVERVLDLAGSPIEVRAPGFEFDDVAVLRGTLGRYHYRGIPRRGGSKFHKNRTRKLRRPPAPLLPPDDRARGTVRIWRARGRGELVDKEQGLVLVAQGLTEDEFYEVWLEDAAGEMQFVGETESTGDGLGYYSIDTRAGDILPFEADVETVRDFRRRRLELRRFGFDEPSLIAILPRLR